MMPKSLPQQLLAQFKLPPRDLAELSFCNGNRPAAVKSWAQALPATRINYISVLLYKALPEISRLKTSPDNRLEMLEALRPYVQNCIQGLCKHFLNQPLILPEAPLKSAVIAQALQKHMTTGYCTVAEEWVGRTGKKGVEDKLALACHRAISGYGLLLLRSYQLYSQAPENLWLELHSLYRVAEHFELLQRTVTDFLLVQSSGSTLDQAYLRILLLACARPSQMRQTDVVATYEVLEDWSRLARLESPDPDTGQNLFIVNLSADLAPLYKSRFAAKGEPVLRDLNTYALLSALKQQRQFRGGEPSAIAIPRTLSIGLLDHLETAWGASQQRSFERRPSMESLDVCVGLGNLHHYSAGEMSFDEFLGTAGDEEIDLDSMGNDPWTSVGNKGGSPADHPYFTVNVVNSGPGGYCLEWNKRIPAQVKAGEVLGLREAGRHRWSLGVIRWIQQNEGSTRLGIQLLAPKATPYGAAVEQPTGDYSDYRRVLMLPELKAANQAATLITAFAPFQEGHRLKLNRHGEHRLVQLSRRVFSTGSVSQFTFRELELPTEGTDSPDESTDWD